MVLFRSVISVGRNDLCPCGSSKKFKKCCGAVRVADQSSGYAGSKLKHLNNNSLPFVDESTGVLTYFTDYRDPKPRSRPLFTFHRPETLREWLSKAQSLRARMQKMPELHPLGLRECQTVAINNLEQSFCDVRPRALVQMATAPSTISGSRCSTISMPSSSA